MLQDVLDYHIPATWKQGIDYDTELYHLIDLEHSSSEFNNIKKPFEISGLEVSSIKRVQNPYILGRYVLQKEKNQMKNEYIDEMVAYHSVMQVDLKNALQYNLDVRRYLVKSQSSFKKPAFSFTPSSAITTSKSKIIIVCKVMKQGNVSRDTEYMPEYVVELA